MCMSVGDETEANAVYFILFLLKKKKIKAANILLIIRTKNTLGFSSLHSTKCPPKIPNARSNTDCLNHISNFSPFVWQIT